jgi:REP element-mobilizing transposase RayT/DNA-binding response OmpR family regulator
MPTPLLVFTSDLPFGELLRQSLEKTGRFVVLVTGKQEIAATYMRDFNPELAFLDTSLTENDLLKTGAFLRQANPEIIFVVISETGWHSALEELFPRDYLSKPFQMPDLLEMMEKFFRSSLSLGNPSLKKKAGQTNDLPWLSDVTRAAQHLTRLTLESSAQAALITRTGQLWAYAGQLPQSAASELADTLSHYWDRQEENDLVRFVRLASTNAEHMLYATRLAEGMVLALVFDAETPFSTIRGQASQLVHSLSTSPSEETLDEDKADSETGLSSLSNTLSNIPAPNPQPDLPAASGYDFGPAASGSRNKTNPGIHLPPDNSPHFSRESSQVMRHKPLVDTDQNEDSPSPFDKTAPFEYIAIRTDPALETTQETHPQTTSESVRKIVLEPVSAAVYNLDYACMLVPRFPQHHMTGDLLDQLGEWVPQICIAFAWRLEYISVRPDYLLWIVDVPPATSPSYLMRIFRQQTSGRIFNEFPRFKKENPSGDFWAPGYLIIGGSQPPPAQLIKDFIAQTRQRQGIPPQINR